MSKFCGNCGAQVPEGANVCGNCGTPVAAAAAPVNAQVNAPVNAQVNAPVNAQVNAQANAPVAAIPGVNTKADSSKIKKLIVPAVAAVAAVVALIVVIGIFSSSSGCKGIIKDYVKAMEKCDGEKKYNLTVFPDIVENLDEDDYYYFDEDEMIDEFEDGIEWAYEWWEDDYGDNLKFKVEEIEEKKVKESEKEDIIEEFEDEYDLEVKDVKRYH